MSTPAPKALVAIETYDAAEAEARRRHPNRVIQAFSPVTFANIGYPARVRTEGELAKYIDVMQERRFDRYLDDVLERLSDDELELFQWLTAEVANMTQGRFGITGTGRNAIAHSLNVLRHIEMVAPGGGQRVLELGPGSGYLGALLMAHGYPYLSSDVAQAFYLYQNRLMASLYPGRCHDLAGTDLGTDELDALLAPGAAEPACAHLPWWRWVECIERGVPVVDVLTCNHALCEMHHDALACSLELGRRALERSLGARLFVLEGWGWDANNRNAFVLEQLYSHGFVVLHHDARITVLGLRSMYRAGEYAEPGRMLGASTITWYNGKLYVHDDIKEQAPLPNPVSAAIVAKRQAAHLRQTVPGARVLEYVTALVGASGLQTADERFLDFCGHPRE